MYKRGANTKFLETKLVAQVWRQVWRAAEAWRGSDLKLPEAVTNHSRSASRLPYLVILRTTTVTEVRTTPGLCNENCSNVHTLLWRILQPLAETCSKRYCTRSAASAGNEKGLFRD